MLDPYVLIRKITWLNLWTFSVFDQIIKQERKSEAFKKHWLLPECKRNARKDKKTPLNISTLFSFFSALLIIFTFLPTISHTIWQNFLHYFPVFHFLADALNNVISLRPCSVRVSVFNALSRLFLVVHGGPINI